MLNINQPTKTCTSGTYYNKECPFIKNGTLGCYACSGATVCRTPGQEFIVCEMYKMEKLLELKLKRERR